MTQSYGVVLFGIPCSANFLRIRRPLFPAMTNRDLFLSNGKFKLLYHAVGYTRIRIIMTNSLSDYQHDHVVA